MKFLCVECDEQMAFDDRAVPGDGTLAAAFRCPRCGRRIAMLTNPMETQLVASLGVKIGGRTITEQPLETIRGQVATGRADAFVEDPPSARLAVRWSPDAEDRLTRVPGFVRGMVKRIYMDYAREHGIETITPALMDTARTELGLEGM